MGHSRGKNAVENFVCGTVATHGKETTITLAVRFAREVNGMSRAGGSDDVDAYARFAQTCQGRPGELRRAAAASSGIYDSEEAFHRCAEIFLDCRPAEH